METGLTCLIKILWCNFNNVWLFLHYLYYFIIISCGTTIALIATLWGTGGSRQVLKGCLSFCYQFQLLLWNSFVAARGCTTSSLSVSPAKRELYLYHQQPRTQHNVQYTTYKLCKSQMYLPHRQWHRHQGSEWSIAEVSAVGIHRCKKTSKSSGLQDRRKQSWLLEKHMLELRYSR